MQLYFTLLRGTREQMKGEGARGLDLNSFRVRMSKVLCHLMWLAIISTQNIEWNQTRNYCREDDLLALIIQHLLFLFLSPAQTCSSGCLMFSITSQDPSFFSCLASQKSSFQKLISEVDNMSFLESETRVETGARLAPTPRNDLEETTLLPQRVWKGRCRPLKKEQLITQRSLDVDRKL